MQKDEFYPVYIIRSEPYLDEKPIEVSKELVERASAAMKEFNMVQDLLEKLWEKNY